MQELNFDVASDFLVMAATLIHWKSKAILPQDKDPAALEGAVESDELTPEQLLRQLMLHKQYLAAGEALSHLSIYGEDVFSRPNRKPPLEKLWKEMSITGLALTFQDLLIKQRKRKTILKKETISIADKISTFHNRLKMGSRTVLKNLIDDMQYRPEVVATFLASLELARLKKLKVYQEGTYEDIYLELIESLKGFNPGLATGFDSFTNAIEEDIQNTPDSQLSAGSHSLNASEELPLEVPAELLINPTSNLPEATLS